MRLRLKAEKDTWITLGSLLSICTLFGVLVLWPSLSEKRELSARAQASKDRFAQVKSSTAELDRLTLEVAELRKSVDHDAYFVPEQPALGDLLRSIDRSLQRPDIQDRSLNAEEFKRFRDYSTIPLSLEMQTPFLSFADTLRAIEGQRRLTVVDEVRLSLSRESGGGQGLGQDGGAPLVRASMRLTTFFSDGKEVSR